MMDCTRWCSGILWLAATATVADAQDCVLPGPFQRQFQNNVTATLSAANAEGPCALSVALKAGGGPLAAGFLHYRRSSPTTSVRYGFRIDSSALANFNLTNLLRNVQLFSASSPVVVGADGSLPWSHLLLIQLAGGNPSPKLVLTAANALGVGGVASQLSIPLTQALNTLRVEINVGVGSAGFVRYWLNTSFNDPPTGTFGNGGLDNAAWIGVIAAEVGVSSPSISFRNDYSGSAIVLDQIESSDDLLLWSDFETLQ